jgi:nucleolar protein 12
MEPTKLKFTKRKLRVTRYNNKGSGLASAKTEPKHSSKGLAKTSSMTNKESAATTIKHHGDPLLGDRLKGLSKEERKDAKKNDANRLARRLEKKKARLELEKSLAKPAKDRVRVRKLKAISGAKGSRKPSKRTQL